MLVALVAFAAQLGPSLGRARAAEAEEPPRAPAPGRGSLTLLEALARVAAVDPRTAERTANVEVARVAVRRAEWNRVSGALGVSASEAAGALGLGAVGNDAAALGTTTFESHTASAYASVRVPLYAGGSIDGAIDGARARHDAARDERQRTLQEQKAAAARAYADVAFGAHTEGIALRALGRAEELTEAARRRANAGVAAEADVRRAEVNVAGRREELEARRGQRSRAAAVLRATLLLPGDVELADDLASIAALAELPGGRGDVAAARASVTAAEADRAVAFAGYLPRIDAFGQASYGNAWQGAGTAASGLGTTASAGATPNGATAGLWAMPAFSGTAYAGAQLTWNVFDFFATRDNVARADGEIARAQAVLAQRTQQAQRDAAEASARLEHAANRVRILAEGVERGRDTVRIETRRYASGMALFSETLQAELLAIDLESRFAQSLYDAAIARVDLILARGLFP
jgi:multidrug efflux system outer membrane protein